MNPIPILLLITGSLHLQAQTNLVRNGSFEEFIKCPNYLSDFDDYVKDWFNPTRGTPNYYNACSNAPEVGVPNNYFGTLEAKKGKAYVGINTADAFREYIAVQLTAPLKKDAYYKISFFTAFSNTRRNCTPLGTDILLTENPVFINQVSESIKVPPSVSVQQKWDTPNEWIENEVCYKAKGNERYLTIGDLQYPTARLDCTNGGSSSYYYLDDVQITEAKTIEKTHNLTFCDTENTFNLNLQNIENQLFTDKNITFNWQDGSKQLQRIVTESDSFKVTATVRCTQYHLNIYVQKKNCKTKYFAPNIFSPNGDTVNDFFTIETQNMRLVSLRIFNRWGNQVYDLQQNPKGWDGYFEGKNAPEGVYLYNAILKDEHKQKETLVSGDLTLIR